MKYRANTQFTNKYFDIYKPVFLPAAIVIAFFIILTLSIGDPMEKIFNDFQTSISNNAGWFLVIAVNIFVIVCFAVALSKFGNIRIGGRDAQPEFSTFAWFAMLFSAGMGIGLLFFSVAEPITHYATPPVAVDDQTTQAENAMRYTFLHWGVHAWAIYAVVGLSLAFFAFNRDMPLTFRSIFYPLIGDRVYGYLGDIIDIVAVTATLFGLATSLGFGVQQIATGLNFLFGFPNTVWVQVLLIGIITLAATASVVLGIDKGVRVLSELNMRLGFLFLIAMLILGPTILLLDNYIQNVGAYIQTLATVSTWTESYTDNTWQNDWTLFYWAWWISWSPYVGMFIARVSRGRTVREFVLGVLLVPALLTFFWMTVFGGSALYLELNGIADISTAVSEDISTALFVMLEEFPLTSVTSLIGIILVTSFFVTSSDSGSLVIDSITSGGKIDAPVGQRVFWALSEGGVAATLLLGGGLAALQAVSIATGLPFAGLLIIMCYSLWKGLQNEYDEIIRRDQLRERQRYRDTISELMEKRRTQDVTSK